MAIKLSARPLKTFRLSAGKWSASPAVNKSLRKHLDELPGQDEQKGGEKKGQVDFDANKLVSLTEINAPHTLKIEPRVLQCAQAKALNKQK